MFCVKCGAKNADDYAFCMRCGAPLPKSVEEVVPSPVITEDIPAEETPIPTPEMAAANPEAAPVEEATRIFSASLVPEMPEPTPDATQVLPELPKVPESQEAFDLPEDIANLPEPPKTAPEPAQIPQVRVSTQTEWTPGGAQPEHEPAASAAAPTTPPQAKKPRQARPKAGPLAKTVTVFLSVFLALFILAATIVGLIRTVLSSDTLEDMLENFDPQEITLEADGEEVPMIDYIYDNLDPEVQEHLDKRTIRRLLTDEDVQEQIADLYGRFTAYFTDGGRMRAITAEDIVDLVRDNEDLIREETGYSLDANAYRELEIALEEQVDFTALSRAGMDETFGGALDVVQLGLSQMFYVILLILAALMIALILLAHQKNIFNAVTPLCVVSLVMGTLYLLVAGGIYALTSLAQIPALGFVQPFISVILNRFAILGGVLFLLPLITLITRAILRRKARKHNPV